MATPQTFVATTIGRVAIPKLADTLVKTGADKFVKQYGQKAFEAVLGTSIGARAYSKTEEYITEYLNHIDTGGDEESFVPKGSMPTATRSEQMDAVMAVPNTTPFSGDLKVPGVIAPDATEMEKEAQKIRDMTMPVGFPADPPIKVDTTTGDSEPPKIETTEEFPIEDKPLPKPPGFGEGDKIDIPIITSMKDGKPEFKYPTEEEIKEYINEENEFWKENIKNSNEKNPQYSPKNMPQVVEADKHFGAAAYSFQNYNESQLIYMSPQEYLDLTKNFRPEESKEQLGSKMNVKNLENILKEGGELANIPFLNVAKVGNDYVVSGQEGIHRAKAFKNLGYNQIPVVIQGTGKGKESDRGKDSDIENKIYTATPKSYLYNQPWAQKYIGFIPESIISKSKYNKDTKEYEDIEVKLVKPTDFYDVLTKEKLFKTDNVNTQTEDIVRGIGDNNPPSSIEEETTENITQDNFITKDNKSITNNLTTQNFLDDKLMDELLVIRGGIKGYNENMSSDFPKMPGATKAKMEIQLQKKLFDKYKINEYPEGETPETVTKERQEYLIHTYNKRLAAIEYVTSVAYDVIGRTDKEAMIVVDEDGLPIAGAKVESTFSGPKTYSKDALTITEMGSVFKNAGDQLFNDIIERAKKENKKFIVAEDLTSEGALQALKDRGFRTTTTKDTKKFKGHKIRRPNGRSAVQKNLVLDLSKEIVKEQTDNLLKNK